MRNGFTLIELLIVIVIMGLILGVGVANFRDFGRRQEVENFERVLIGDLQAASADAASGKRLPGCTGSYLGDRVDFAVTGTQSTSYSIYSACSTNSALLKNVTLPSGVYLTFNQSAVGGLISLTFKPLQLGSTAPTSGFTITVNHTQNAQQKSITVTPTAQIE